MFNTSIAITAQTKKVEGVTYTAVDDIRSYIFLDEIYALLYGNPIFTFSLSADIAQILQEQWTGLFERLLRESGHKKQTTLIDELQRGLNTVDKLVQYLNEQNLSHKTTIDEILLANHPVFSVLKEEMRNGYRVYFTNVEKLLNWVDKGKFYERDFLEGGGAKKWRFYVWKRVHSSNARINILRVSKDLFEVNGSLKPMTLANWKDECLSFQTYGLPDDDFEIPF